MEWSKIVTDDKLKTGYKFLSNLAQRIAYNLGNTASQTEVKIISCIPIDVTDFQKKIIELEKGLTKAIREKKQAEKALKSNTSPMIYERTNLRDSNFQGLPGHKCLNVPMSVSCGDPVLYSKQNNRKMRRDKRIRQQFCKNYESFYKETGMGCHGDRLQNKAEKESSEDTAHETVNSEFSHLEPVQYYHVDPMRETRILNPFPPFEIIANDTHTTFLDACGINPTGEEIVPEHSYLEPIAECCRLEATAAFHRIDSRTELQSSENNGDTELKNHSSVFQNREPAPEVRNLTTTYDWYSSDAITRRQQTENISKCKSVNPKPNSVSPKDLFITECVNPYNIHDQSQQESISGSQEIEVTFKRLGLPNTEPKRKKVPIHNNSQGTQVIHMPPEHTRGGLSASLPCNQETQAPTIDSCSCCISKQLTAEQLLHMPRGPRRKYLHDYQQTLSSSEISAECNNLYEQGITHQRRNALNNKRTEHHGIAKKQHDNITNSYLEGIVTKYRQSTMQSTCSQYSAPMCRDADSDSCSCCAGVFYDIDLVNCQLQCNHYSDSSNSSHRQYYDDKLYDLIPVKEKSKRNKTDKKAVEKCRQTQNVYKNDVIVNYHTLQKYKLNKKTRPVNKSIKSINLQRPRQNHKPRRSFADENIATKLKHHISNGTKETRGTKIKHTECQTDQQEQTAENKENQLKDKDDDSLSQIKQTLQFVLERFRPYTHRGPTKRDAVMQAETCQCDRSYGIHFNDTFMFPQVTPAAFVYPTMPILTSPWINNNAMFNPSKQVPFQQNTLQAKPTLGVGRSLLQERNSSISETNEFIENGEAKIDSNKDRNRAVCIKKFADVCEQAGEPTDVSTNEKSKDLIHTIIISTTNITKKCKNKKIYCCLSKQHSIKSLKRLDYLNFKNELIQESCPNDKINKSKYTGSTVREVIEELNKMEEYITRSEFRIGDVVSSKGSVEKPKKKFRNIFRSFKNIFKTKVKHMIIDKRMSCDNVTDVDGKGFCISRVHLVYPTKHNFCLTSKQNRFHDKPQMCERYSYIDLHSKKCREAVLSSRRRQSREIKF